MPNPNGPENTEDVTEAAELTEGADPAEGDAPAEDAEPTFLNRAARRGKSSSQQQPQGKGKSSGGRGSVQGPRQWGTRRSG